MFLLVLVFGVWCLVFGVWCLLFGVWCLVFVVCCLLFVVVVVVVVVVAVIVVVAKAHPMGHVGQGLCQVAGTPAEHLAVSAATARGRGPG
jgi:hypothetical protein